jgi:outer membrane protein, heavy metal efflux system
MSKSFASDYIQGSCMIIKSIMVFLLSFNLVAGEVSFKDYVHEIAAHYEVLALKLQSEALNQESQVKGTWGDPEFKLSALNFPKETISRNKSPMTGIKYSLIQKIAFTNKYGNIEDAYQLAAQARMLDADNQKIFFIKTLWHISINKRMILSELKILNENKEWIENTLSVSKKLYTNGKIGQQAILDIQVRRNNLEAMIYNQETTLQIITSQLSYFNNNYSSIDLESVPWKLLDSENIASDFVEYAHKKNLASKEQFLLAQRKSFMPDIKLELSYTRRNNLDGLGDFVGASLSFPLPFSTTQYGNYGKAIRERAIANATYKSYKNRKRAKVKEFTLLIKKMTNELDILSKKTKGFAVNSRDITSRSYRLGKASYIELLNSELQLQKILLKENKLVSQLDKIKVERNYLKGAALYESSH